MSSLKSPIIALCLVALSFTKTAHAEDVAGAANAFSRAQKAELSGDHAAAAELYELADQLAQAPEALRSALRARKDAGQLPIAALHAETLLERYPDDKRSVDLANATLEEAERRLMRFEVDCEPSDCSLLVDGAAASPDTKAHHIVYFEPGRHEVIATFGSDKTEAQIAEGDPGTRGVLTFVAPPRPEEPAEDASDIMVAGGSDTEVGDQGVDDGGLSPWIFVAGAAVTAGLGATTVWSGLDVLDAHDAYKGNETQEAYEAGKDKELRTNVLLGATIAAGVTTGVLAFLTDWDGDDGTQARRTSALQAGIGFEPGGASFVLTGSY